MAKQQIICLLGNNGCGKSSICELINTKNDTIIGVERSNGLGIKYGIDPSMVDKLTLEYIFNNDNFNQIKLPDQTIHQEDIYWIILDCQVDSILKRLETRSKKTIWETRKALHYFQQRFRHISAHFGIPLIDTTHQTLEQVYDQILQIVGKYSNYYQSYRQIGTQILNYDLIQQYDIENKLSKIINTYDFDQVSNLPEYAQGFNNINQQQLYIRWYINNNAIEIEEEKNLLRIGEYQLPIAGTIFRLMTEGESKKIYRDISGNPFTKNLIFIVLKSTIYSHSQQRTGEITNLNSIRACGSQIFLEMMWRNDLKHCYYSINSHGIIISDYLNQISPLEIIVKRYCQGTDQNSFYDILENENIVIPDTNGEYLTGPYVRLDWRNPNHISPKTKKALNTNPYYYLYEQTIGKEEFFNKILMNKQYAIPVGDKNITEDLVSDVIDIKATKMSVLKMFMVIQSYFSRVNLIIKDVCFMLDQSGEYFWSEINQDCMRITTKENNENKFDKDIWRIGGLKSSEEILTKWTNFNQIFIQYFNQNRFHQTEIFNYNQYFYQQDIEQLLHNKKLKIPRNLKDLWWNIHGKHPRRVLVTMDLFNEQPVLVKSAEVYETHSNGDYRQAMEKLGIFSDILIVDLNGAFGELDTKNRGIIKELARKYHVHTGGGLRSLTDLDDMLKSGVRRCVVASADDTLITKIPKDRLIVEISINEQNEVLIHGRRTNTHVNIIDRITQLIEIGVNVISITFVQTEGHLSGIPRLEIRDLIIQIPSQIERIYIGGGITTLDDLEYLWSFSRVIPLIGSAIWKNTITIGQIYSNMIRFDQNGFVSAVIQDVNGLVKGLCHMNEESIEETCEERKLYRSPRQSGRSIMKGEISGHIQDVIKMSLDCDSDALLITVDSRTPFCHSGNHSCFTIQTSLQGNFSSLAEHIKSRMHTDSYTGKMQRYPQFALAKVMEEFWEVVASHKDDQISECSDLFVHLIMYLNGIEISMEEIYNELNTRRWAARTLIVSQEIVEKKSKEIIIGITTSKYTNKTDDFAEEQLGIKIIRHPGRSLFVEGKIIDREKFSKYFGSDENIKLSLFTSKPKDMIWLLAAKRVTHILTYETVVENYPKLYTLMHEAFDPTIGLALICRKGECIEPEKWTAQNKIIIAAEHVCQVTRFFEKHNINHRTYHLDKVTGSSEGFLINSKKYLLADAVVESGRTLDENNLEIWKIIIPKGQVRIGLYRRYDEQN